MLRSGFDSSLRFRPFLTSQLRTQFAALCAGPARFPARRRVKDFTNERHVQGPESTSGAEAVRPCSRQV